MPQDRTRKLVITGVMGAISVLLGVTHWGFIPWFGGVSLTIMHVPVIIAAVLEGPIVGAGCRLDIWDFQYDSSSNCTKLTCRYMVYKPVTGCITTTFYWTNILFCLESA